MRFAHLYDGISFNSSIGNKKNRIIYDEQYQLFFVQPSYFPSLVPRVLDIRDDGELVEVTVAFAEDYYGEVFTLDGEKLSGAATEDNDMYEEKINEYIVSAAPKLNVTLQRAEGGELRILDFYRQ